MAEHIWNFHIFKLRGNRNKGSIFHSYMSTVQLLSFLMTTKNFDPDIRCGTSTFNNFIDILQNINKYSINNWDYQIEPTICVLQGWAASTMPHRQCRMRIHFRHVIPLCVIHIKCQLKNTTDLFLFLIHSEIKCINCSATWIKFKLTFVDELKLL